MAAQSKNKVLQIILILALALIVSACSRATPSATTHPQAITSLPGTGLPGALASSATTSTPPADEQIEEIQASPTQAASQATQSSSSTQQEAASTSQATVEGSPGNGESGLTATPAATQPGQESQTENTAPQAAAPTATTAQSTATTPSSAQTGGTCSEKAAFYGDVTIPDKTPFQQGEAFVKIWKVRNEGTCDWGSGYSLVFAGGDIMNGPASQALPSAAIGETVEISVDLTAPTGGGVFTGNWEFEDPHGQRFGVGAGGHDYIWAQISVNWIGEQETSAAEGTTVLVGTGLSGGNSCPVEANPSYESQVLALINQARADQGVGPLAGQNQLAEAALVHSTDMACQDYVDHIGSDGSRYYDRILAQGYSYAAASENIYVGDPAFGGTPEGAFEWWMNSDIHRRTILNPKYSQAGVAYVYRPGSTYGGYYTVVFAGPG